MRCNELTHAILQRIPYHHYDRVKTAYMELLANALQASERYGGQTISIAWGLSDGLLTLRLTNEGVEFTPVARDFLMPDPYAERGRGIPLATTTTAATPLSPPTGNSTNRSSRGRRRPSGQHAEALPAVRTLHTPDGASRDLATTPIHQPPEARRDDHPNLPRMSRHGPRLLRPDPLQEPGIRLALSILSHGITDLLGRQR
jgi:hypothetical protein